MDVARGEKFLTTRLEPTSTGVGLTLRAVPVAAANGELTITLPYGEFFLMGSGAPESAQGGLVGPGWAGCDSP